MNVDWQAIIIDASSGEQRAQYEVSCFGKPLGWPFTDAELREMIVDVVEGER